MLVGLIGKAGSGKTTLANVFQREGGFTKKAFGDGVKSTILKAGILTEREIIEKGPKCRFMLQHIATDLIREQVDPDFWVRIIRTYLYSIDLDSKNIVIDDVRFLNEAKMIKDFRGTLVRIYRPGVETMNHRSETEMDQVKPDILFMNDWNLLTLERHGRQLIDELTSRGKEVPRKYIPLDGD